MTDHIQLVNGTLGRAIARAVQLRDGRVLAVFDDGSGIAFSRAELFDAFHAGLELAQVDAALANAAANLRTAGASAGTVTARDEADAARKVREVESLAPRRHVGDLTASEFLPGVEFEGGRTSDVVRRARDEQLAKADEWGTGIR